MSDSFAYLSFSLNKSSFVENHIEINKFNVLKNTSKRVSWKKISLDFTKRHLTFAHPLRYWTDGQLHLQSRLYKNGENNQLDNRQVTGKWTE